MLFKIIYKDVFFDAKQPFVLLYESHKLLVNKRTKPAKIQSLFGAELITTIFFLIRELERLVRIIIAQLYEPDEISFGAVYQKHLLHSIDFWVVDVLTRR
jgi:hypothetical protein